MVGSKRRRGDAVNTLKFIYLLYLIITWIITAKNVKKE